MYLVDRLRAIFGGRGRRKEGGRGFLVFFSGFWVFSRSFKVSRSGLKIIYLFLKFLD